MDNVGPADGGGSKKEEPLFPIDEVTELVGEEGTGKTTFEADPIPKWYPKRRIHASDVAQEEARCDTQRKRQFHSVKALAGGEVAIGFEGGGCVVIRDKHGATVLRITHLGEHHGEPTLEVMPYSAGAPDAEGFDEAEPEDEGYYVRCDV